MRFDVTIFADSPNELQATFHQIADAIPTNVFDAPGRGFTISVTPDPVPDYARPYVPVAEIEPTGQAVADSPGPPPGQDVEDPGAGITPEVAKRVRRTKAQIEADEKAALLAAASSSVSASTNGKDPVAMSPAEAKIKALDLLRECYAMEGGPNRIKDVQRQFAVAKFIDVPDARGDELYARALTLKNELMPV